MKEPGEGRERLADTTPFFVFPKDLNLRQVIVKSPCLRPKGNVRSGMQD